MGHPLTYATYSYSFIGTPVSVYIDSTPAPRWNVSFWVDGAIAATQSVSGSSSSTNSLGLEMILILQQIVQTEGGGSYTTQWPFQLNNHLPVLSNSVFWPPRGMNVTELLNRASVPKTWPAWVPNSLSVRTYNLHPRDIPATVTNANPSSSTTASSPISTIPRSNLPFGPTTLSRPTVAHSTTGPTPTASVSEITSSSTNSTKTIEIAVPVVVGILVIVVAIVSLWLLRKRRRRRMRSPGWLSGAREVNDPYAYGKSGPEAELEGQKESVEDENFGPEVIAKQRSEQGPGTSVLWRSKYEKARTIGSAEMAERGDPQHLDSIEITPHRSELFTDEAPSPKPMHVDRFTEENEVAESRAPAAQENQRGQSSERQGDEQLPSRS